MLRGPRRAYDALRRLRAGHEDGEVARSSRSEGRARARTRRWIGRRRRRSSTPLLMDAQAHTLKIIKRFGFDASFARLYLTVHPFRRRSGRGHRPNDALQGRRHHVDLHRDDVRGTALRACFAVAGATRSAMRSRRCTSRRAGYGENIVGRAPGSGTTFTRFQEAFLKRSATSTRTASTGRSTASSLPGSVSGRGDVQTAHHPSLRAGAGDHVRHDRTGGAARRLELPLRGVLGPVRRHVGVPQDVDCPAAASATSAPTGSVRSSCPDWEKVPAEIPGLHDQVEQGE